tara:strand:- start:132 stop:527 length:396 start_codon:yes stop_codon:yes gene_type:complete
MKPTTNPTKISSANDTGSFWTAEEKQEMLQRRKAREALGSVSDAILVLREMCMTLSTWTYGETTQWGKKNKKAGQKGSMYLLDGEKFCTIANKCLPAGADYVFKSRGSKNEIITLEHVDGKTPLVEGHVYN